MRLSLERQVAQIFDDCREMLKIVGDFSYESTPPEIWTT